MSATTAIPAESAPARASVWEWLTGAILAANLSWTTLCLGGFRADTMLVTSGLNALLLAVYLAGRVLNPGGLVRRIHPAGGWFLPFLVYAAANVIWVSPVPWLGWRDWLGWAQMILVFWVVLNGVRAKAVRSLVFGGLVAVAFVAVAMACYQKFVKPDWLMLGRTQADQFIGRASGCFGIPNSLAALLLLLIPPLGVLTVQRGAGAVQRVLCGYLTLAFSFGLVLTISRGAWLALALVLVAWPVLAVRGSWARRAGLALLVGFAVFAAGSVLYLAMPKVRERLMALKLDAGERSRPIMWRGAWLIFREFPVWGGGAGGFNTRFEKHRPEHYQDAPQWAHNDYLNTLSDYGAVGFGLFFGVAAGIVWRCQGRRASRHRDWLDDPAVARALMAGAVAFGLQLFVDFHFKIPALAMAFAVIAALIVQLTWPADETLVPVSRLAWAGNLVAALGMLVATGFLVFPLYRGEFLRYGARASINRMAGLDPRKPEQLATLARARADLTQAVEISPGNAQAWADLAYATALIAHVEPARAAELGREAERQAAHALALSRIVPEFWVRQGVALDLQGRWGEAGGAFIQALTLAPASAPTWFYHAFHLGLRSGDPSLALAAAEFCLRLDPGNKDAQALCQRLATSRRAP